MVTFKTHKSPKIGSGPDLAEKGVAVTVLKMMYYYSPWVQFAPWSCLKEFAARELLETNSMQTAHLKKVGCFCPKGADTTGYCRQDTF